MKSLYFLIVSATLLLLIACAPPQPAADQEPAGPTSEEDRQAIQQAGDQFATAFKAGDVETLVGLYSSDGIVMPPNAPTIQGHDGIRNWMQPFFQQFTVSEATLTTDEIVILQDTAYRRGAFRMTMQPSAGGDSMTDEGKYLEIWERKDGSWKMTRDIWNSNGPPAGSSAPPAQ